MNFDFNQLPDVLKPFQDKILATIKPTVTMTLHPASGLSLWQSKVGGQPYLPLDVEYPKDKNGQPLALLAQINFAEVPTLTDFPNKGILQFYIATDDLVGLDFDDQQKQSGFRVLYFENVIEDMTQLKQDFSDIKPEENDEDYFVLKGQYLVEFQIGQQPISISDFAFGQKILDVQELYDFEDQYEGADFYEEFVKPYDDNFTSTGHRLGGYPSFTQDDARYKAEHKDYILLFQLDTDFQEGNHIMWGDAGVGNFFIHPDDLKKRDFSKVLYNWDCC